jgi:hypothetical protein
MGIPGLILSDQALDSGGFEVTVALSSPLLPGDALFLDSLLVTNQAGTWNVLTSATGFDPTKLVTPTLQCPIGGVTSGTVSFQEYVDANNTPFGMSQTPGAQGPNSGGSFSDNTAMTPTLNGLFSITKTLTISQGAGGFTGVSAWGVVRSLLGTEPDLSALVQRVLVDQNLGQLLELPALAASTSRPCVDREGIPPAQVPAGPRGYNWLSLPQLTLGSELVAGPWPVTEIQAAIATVFPGNAANLEGQNQGDGGGMAQVACERDDILICNPARNVFASMGDNTATPGNAFANALDPAVEDLDLAMQSFVKEWAAKD